MSDWRVNPMNMWTRVDTPTARDGYHRGRREWQSTVLVFVTLLFCYIYSFPRWADWGQKSRLDLTMAIVDHGTFAIDMYHENTGDKAFFDGHYYTDKSVGPSFLAVPVYALVRGPLRMLTSVLEPRLQDNVALAETLLKDGGGLLFDRVYLALALTLVTAITVSVPSALMGVLFFRFLENFTSYSGLRLLLTLGLALGTSAFPYSGMFYQHQPAAVALFTSFVLLYRMRVGRTSWRQSWLVGALLGFALITDYPTVLIVIPLGLYALYHMPDKRLVILPILGALPMLALMIVYNLVVFKSLLPTGYFYSTNWQEEHQSGFLSLTHPMWDAFWGITFSPHRGLFFFSPFLLLAWPGFYVLWRLKRYRSEFLVCLLSTLGLLLFNSSSIMWWGGYAVGPRYLIPMLPFISLAPVFFLDRHWDRPIMRSVTYALVGLSVGLIMAVTIAGQQFPDYTWNALIDYAVPRLAGGDIARNLGTLMHLPGWSSLIPLAVFLGMALFLIVKTRAPAATEVGTLQEVIISD